MTVLTTVLGPTEAEKLGYKCTASFVLDTPAAAINPALRADDEARSLQDLPTF